MKYACVWALNKPLKKLEMSIQPIFITLTGIPQQLSVTGSVTTNSKAQLEMKSTEGKRGWVVCCFHTKYPILCSQYRQKRIHQTAPRTVSPWFPLSPWGPWWRERRQRITPSLPGSKHKSQKVWQLEWDMRYVQDDRWGQWCQWGPKLLPHPGEWRHSSD